MTKKDKKIVIATHGELADGFKSALNIIVGDLPQVMTICGYTSPDFQLDDIIQALMTQHDFESYDLVVCTDMMGGSINNGFVKYLGEYSFSLITNINLAFLVDFVLTQGEVTKAHFIEKECDPFLQIQYIQKDHKQSQELDDL